VTGIEPALSAWEAEVLPLNYTRVADDPACPCYQLALQPRSTVQGSCPSARLTVGTRRN
jgi:hypothetical protein